MSRQIRFRAWSKKDKVWSYFELTGAGFNHHNLQTSDYKPFEWQQFTGLHDKNGKEIFEGDIVNDKSAISAGSACLIKWGDDECGWLVDGQKGCHHMMGYVKERYEVIGNVFKNPELLK